MFDSTLRRDALFRRNFTERRPARRWTVIHPLTNSLAELSTFDWHSVPWFLVAYTGVVTTAFALYAETVALKYIPSEKASVIYTTEPLWGAAFAYVLLGERMGINGYIGGALILASSFLSSSSNKAIVLPGEEEEASAMKKIE